MKFRWQTTAEEREIIDKLPNERIELWAKEGDFWKIYREVIKETKLYLKKHGTSKKGI